MYKRDRRFLGLFKSGLKKRVYKFTHRSDKKQSELFHNACFLNFPLHMNQDGTFDLDKIHKALVKLGFTVKKKKIKSHYDNFYNPENDCQYEFTLSTLHIIGTNLMRI